MKTKLASLSLAIVVALSTLPGHIQALTTEQPIQELAAPKIIISEIKLGGDGEPKEYIALYNQSAETISLDGWVIEYAKPSFNSAGCSSASWLNYSVSGSANATALSGSLAPGSLSTPIIRSLTDNSDGSLHLVDSSGLVQDLVGWGPTAACYETSRAITPARSTSLQRYLGCQDSLPIDNDDNSEDFATDQTPSPGVLPSPANSDCAPAGGSGGSGGATDSCEGVIISEILPNPEGSDSGYEFIELYNPTNKSISLKNCQLQTSSSSLLYKINEDVALAPYSFEAFYDGLTGLSLANSAGGTVWLISAAGVEIDEVSYQPELEDDQSWALSEGQWQKTYSPTPGAINAILSQKPCEPGKVRSPETNRCINAVSVSSSLGACPIGKERNPATNRCRTVASLASVLRACASDQIRNPATNRCKKVGVGSGLVPCKPGQERNADTNRCRKVLGAASSSKSLPKVQDLPAPDISKSLSWWFAGMSIVGAISYGIFEWRNEILALVLNLKSRIGLILSN